MASDVDYKQNEATCSNKTKPKYKLTVAQSIRHILLFSVLQPIAKKCDRLDF